MSYSKNPLYIFMKLSKVKKVMSLERKWVEVEINMLSERRLRQVCWGSERTQQVKVSVAKPVNPSSLPGKGGTDSLN